MKLILPILFILTNILLVSSQVKVEQESLIKVASIPKQAVLFINKIEGIKKLKWFKEQMINETSVEAKFKVNKKKYSAEFNTEGVLEDIEVIVNLEQLDSIIIAKINQHLKTTFNRYKIKKIQEQLKGSKVALLKNFNHYNPNLITGYELVLSGKHNKETKLYEYFFDKNGNFISQQEIIPNIKTFLED